MKHVFAFAWVKKQTKTLLNWGSHRIDLIPVKYIRCKQINHMGITTLKNKVKYQHQTKRKSLSTRGFVMTIKIFKVGMICYKLPCSYFKSPWLFLEWEVGPTYLQISLLKARPLPDPIDMGSTILDESSGFKLAGCSQF